MLKSDITGLSKDSLAMVQQIRTVAHSRLEPLSGHLKNVEARSKILDAIRMYFEV